MAYEGVQLHNQYLDESNLVHILYDLSIEDINERKAKAKEYANAKEVADYLGVRIERVWRNRMPNRRIKALNNKEYCVRIKKIKSCFITKK